MAFIQDNYMVEQVPAAIADPTLGNAILPRTPEAGSLWLNAEALHRANDFFIEVCAAIKDQVFGSRVVGECLAQLLDCPAGGCFVTLK